MPSVASPVPVRPRPRAHGACTGFSLVELLVVAAVVVALAGIAWGRYGSIEQAELDRLAAVQLDELARALRAFRADTGFWPGQGPFALASSGASATGGGVDRASLPGIALPAAAVDADQWNASWFAHPANLWQLFERPVLVAAHPLARLAQWDAGHARGWRGPYLDAGLRLFVDMGIDGSIYAGGLSPGALENGLVQRNLPGMPAGRPRPPLDTGCDPDDPCIQRWMRIASTALGGTVPAEHQFERLGRALLYFGPAYGRVRIAHPGGDGRFGGLNLTLPCEPSIDVHGYGADDLVRCLD